MLLLRYQQKRTENAEDGFGRAPEHDMRRKINDRDLKGDSQRAAKRGTLICIFVCGSCLLSLGVVILCVGLFLPVPRKDPTPWLVIGPTCIVLGVLVLLLSVEIIVKLRKISSSTRSSAEPDTPPPNKGNNKCSLVPSEGNVSKGGLPVIVHPATPLQQLDPTTLPVEVVQHR